MAKPTPLAYELNRFIYDAVVALERQIVAQQPQSKLPFVIRKVRTLWLEFHDRNSAQPH